MTVPGTGCKDDGAACEFAVIAGFYFEQTALILDRTDGAVLKLHTEIRSLFIQLLGKFITGDVCDSGIVFDIRSINDLTAVGGRFEYNSRFSGAGRINTGCEPGRAGADDDNVSCHKVYLSPVVREHDGE